MKVSNVTLQGFENYQIKTFKVELLSLSARIGILLPSVIVSGNHETTSNYKGTALNGIGTFNENALSKLVELSSR